MKSHRTPVRSLGRSVALLAAGLVLTAGPALARPLCIALPGGVQLVFTTFKQARGRVKPVSGYLRNVNHASAFQGTTIVSANGYNIGIDLTVAGVGVASGSYGIAPVTTFRSLVGSQVDGSLHVGDALTTCGWQYNNGLLLNYGCASGGAQVVDCALVPAFP